MAHNVGLKEPKELQDPLVPVSGYSGTRSTLGGCQLSKLGPHTVEPGMELFTC